MEVKKVIYAGLFLLPDGDAAAHRVRGIGKILNTLGYQVVYYGLSNDSTLPIDDAHSVYIAEPKPQNKREWLHSQINADGLANLINGTDDLEAVFLYNYQSIPFGKIKKVCRHKGVKVYADCTEWHQAPKGSRFRFLKIADTFKRIHFDDYHVDGLIVISSYLEKYYSECHKIRIPPIFDYKDTRNEQVMLSEIKRFVFTGTISAQKETVYEIVKASEELRSRGYDFSVDIYGISTEEYIRSCNEKESHNNESIIFHGRVSHDECLNAVRNAHFQVFIREANLVNTAGFPTKFGESFASGTPVITTPTSDIPLFLKDGYNGFVVQDSLSDVMEKAIKMSDEEYSKMRKMVDTNYCFDYRSYVDGFKEFLVKQ